jgi:addiction module HigA family antidote
MARKRISPVHPGAYLKELLNELTLSQSRVAREIGVPATRINHVVNGKRLVNAELALRLGRYFGQEPRYWLNLQSRYDLDIAEDKLADKMSEKPNWYIIIIVMQCVMNKTYEKRYRRDSR